MCENTDKMKELLNSWELELFHEHFTNNGIGIKQMKMMNSAHMNELLAPFNLGIRITFQYHFEQWRLNVDKISPDAKACAAALSFNQVAIKTMDQSTQTVESGQLIGVLDHKCQSTQTMPLKISLNNIKNLLVPHQKMPLTTTTKTSTISSTSVTPSTVSGAARSGLVTPICLTMPVTQQLNDKNHAASLVTATDVATSTTSTITTRTTNTLQSVDSVVITPIMPKSSVASTPNILHITPAAFASSKQIETNLSQRLTRSKHNNGRGAYSVVDPTEVRSISPLKSSTQLRKRCDSVYFNSPTRMFSEEMTSIDHTKKAKHNFSIAEILSVSGIKANTLITQYYKHNRFSDNERLELIKLIAQYYSMNNLLMPLQKSYKLEEEILALFPGEKLSDYRTERRGKLYMRYRHFQSNYQKALRLDRYTTNRSILSNVQQRALITDTQSCYAPSVGNDDKTAAQSPFGDLEQQIKSEHFSDDDTWTMGYD